MAQRNKFQTLFSSLSITEAIELDFMRGWFIWKAKTRVYNFYEEEYTYFFHIHA